MDFSVHVARVIARLGEDRLLTFASGNAVTVRGVFSEPYETSPIGIAGIESNVPRFECMTADLSSVSARGGTINIDGMVFRVESEQADGVQKATGFVLSKV